MRYKTHSGEKQGQSRRGCFSPDQRVLLKKKSVLVVDDDPMMVCLVCSMLARIGIVPDRATGGLEALKLLEKVEYDLVVTDLRMPQLNGYELARLVKEECNATVVIIMTGLSSEETDSLRQQPGPVDEWIFKPFEFRKFKELIRGLERKMKRAES